MANSIAFAKNYTTIIDEVYQRAGMSNVLNSGRRMVRAGRNAKLCPAICYPQLWGSTVANRRWLALERLRGWG